MKKRTISIAIVSVLAAAISESAFTAPVSDQPLTINIKHVSLEVALKISKAAIDKCREEGVQVSVTVVDRGGHEQVVMRDNLAMDASIPISKMKAYTAMSFNTPTFELVDRFKGAYSVPKLDSLIISPGGIPITIAGSIMGGIGVSGAPSGLTDEMCAKAGLASVRDDLELE